MIPIFSTNAEVAEGKEVIADNLTAMGVTASATESLTALGAKVLQAGVNVTMTPIENDPYIWYPYDWHNLFTVMASVYDVTKPYMYALLMNRSTPADVLAACTDGEVVVSGGDGDAGKSTKWVVFKRSTQVFNASYGANFKNYILGIAVYNADIFNVTFNGLLPAFLHFNADYSVTPLRFNASQFYGTKLISLITPNVPELKFDYLSAFQGSTLSYVVLQSQQTSLTISGGSTWYGCTSLTSFTMPPNLTSLTISGATTWTNCTSLTRITLNPNWRLTANFSTATALSHDGIVLMFGELVDKRANGINPTTVATNVASPIVTGTNSQFTKVFVVGDTININAAGNRTIASIDSDTQLTLTANAAATGTGLAYNINKTLTLGATNLARVSAPEIQVAIDKGWTIN